MSKYDKDTDEKYGAKLKPLTMKEGFQAWKHDNIHLFGKFGEAGIELVNQVPSERGSFHCMEQNSRETRNSTSTLDGQES